VEHLSEFVTNNLMLFAALLVVLVMLIKTELDHQANKGLLVSPATAIRIMNNYENALILDIREVAEYKKGHINGAKNVPLKEFESKLASYTEYKDKPVLIYCNSGNTTTRAIKSLKKAGFEKISNLEGGIAAWKEANMPLSRSKK